jgi:eukaryotic-like serine/threonine-protein kinase
MFKFITNRSLFVNLLAGLVLLASILMLFMYSLDWITHHGDFKTIPSVVGEDFNKAERMLEGQGFTVVIQDSVYIDTAAPNSIIKQFPEPDAVVKVNRTIYLTINRVVPPMVEMPNLVGYSFRNAEMILKNMGLNIADTSFRPDFAKNSVLVQLFGGTEIAAGTKLQMGSGISLILGDGIGKNEFIVPGVVGMTFEQAKLILESNGLSIGAIMTEGVSDTLNAYIYKQSPERFDESGRRIKIRPGQMMDLWLSITKPEIDSLQF